MSVCCECCVLSGRGLCDRLITRPEVSIECDVSECDREALITRRPWPHWGLLQQGKESGIVNYKMSTKIRNKGK